MAMYKLETNQALMNTNLHAPTRVEKVYMELGFREQFASQERELETHGHVQIGNQLGFHEHQFACTN